MTHEQNELKIKPSLHGFLCKTKSHFIIYSILTCIFQIDAKLIMPMAITSYCMFLKPAWVVPMMIPLSQRLPWICLPTSAKFLNSILYWNSIANSSQIITKKYGCVPYFFHRRSKMAPMVIGFNQAIQKGTLLRNLFLQSGAMCCVVL